MRNEQMYNPIKLYAMETMNLSIDAINCIEEMRNGEGGYEIIKDNIANSLSTLSALVNLGRDDETIAVWTDELLKVMYTLSDYNELVNCLCETADKKKTASYEYLNV